MLDKGFQAYDAKPLGDAFGDVIGQRAQFVDENYNMYNIEGWMDLPVEEGEKCIHTPNLALKVPEVIRFETYEKKRQKKVVFSRKNLWKRDSWRCFTPDTLILMYDGSIVPINEIRVGDKVLDMNGDVQTVEYVHESYRDESILAIRHRGNGDLLTCTLDHRILESDNSFNIKWTESADLTLQSYLSELTLDNFAENKSRTLDLAIFCDLQHIKCKTICRRRSGVD